MMTENIATTLKLAPEMRERIRKLADAKERSPHWVMKQAIDKYVTAEEHRLNFLREGMEAWEDYQATGLHLTADEVDEWMTKIVRGEDPPMPEPHK
jgi:predicted transcriptional regulator